MKNAFFWDVRCESLVKTNVSKKQVASILRVEEIYASGEKC
jgi:hypothetical protein